MAEQVISIDSSEELDYTQWQRDYFDKMTSDEFIEKAVRFEAEHPYCGQGKVLD